MNHSSRSPLLLVTLALALFSLAGCASTPQATPTYAADAWIPPGSVELSMKVRDSRPVRAVASHEGTLASALRPNNHEARHILRGRR